MMVPAFWGLVDLTLCNAHVLTLSFIPKKIDTVKVSTKSRERTRVNAIVEEVVDWFQTMSILVVSPSTGLTLFLNPQDDRCALKQVESIPFSISFKCVVTSCSN